jgi:hypothetical protein
MPNMAGPRVAWWSPMLRKNTSYGLAWQDTITAVGKRLPASSDSVLLPPIANLSFEGGSHAYPGYLRLR